MRKLVFILGLCFSVLFAGAAIAEEIDVLIVLSDSSGVTEADVIKSYEMIGDHHFNYSELNLATGGTRPIEGAVMFADVIGSMNLSDYHIIWLTWNGPGHDGDYFMAGVESELLSYVENGGIIYMSAFDDNFADADGNQIGGWMPIGEHPASISNTADSELTVTAEGEATGIFDGVDTSGLVLDDNFASDDPGYIALATRDDNGEMAAYQLNYGSGAYLGVCTDARSTSPPQSRWWEIFFPT